MLPRTMRQPQRQRRIPSLVAQPSGAPRRVAGVDHPEAIGIPLSARGGTYAGQDGPRSVIEFYTPAGTEAPGFSRNRRIAPTSAMIQPTG